MLKNSLAGRLWAIFRSIAWGAEGEYTRPYDGDDLDTIEDMRAAIMALALDGPDGDCSSWSQPQPLFADLLTARPPDSGLIERMNRDLAAVGYELRRTVRH